MKKIDFLANPTSPHVRHWETVLIAGDIKPLVYGIPQHDGLMLVRSVHTLGPTWARYLPSSLNYVLSGIWLRLGGLGPSQSAPKFFHAHNTSGYGLVAWLSGVNYIVTTYGTEIYDAKNRGWLYRYLISKVLGKAILITSTSEQMTSALMSEFRVPREKIREFSLGVSPIFCHSDYLREIARSELDISSDSKVWISNRRVHPLYRIKEIINAFDSFAKEYPDCYLIILEGDSDRSYFDDIQALAEKSQNVRLIRGFIPQSQLKSLLCASDFSISIPITDQLSSSILEAMACGVVPIINSIDAYKPICHIAFNLPRSETNLTEQLEQVFQLTAKLSSDELLRYKSGVLESVAEAYSQERVLLKIIEIYSEVI